MSLNRVHSSQHRGEASLVVSDVWFWSVQTFIKRNLRASMNTATPYYNCLHFEVKLICLWHKSSVVSHNPLTSRFKVELAQHVASHFQMFLTHTGEALSFVTCSKEEKPTNPSTAGYTCSFLTIWPKRSYFQNWIQLHISNYYSDSQKRKLFHKIRQSKIIF